MRILLIDDQADLIAPALRLQLSGHGHELVATDAWADVLRWVRDQRPEVVLVDLNMPGVSGVAVSLTIKRFCDVAVFLYSGVDPAEVQAAVGRSRADGFVPKGRPEELLRALDHAATLRSGRSRLDA